MAEEFRVSLGLEIKSGEIENIRTQINNIQASPVDIQFQLNQQSYRRVENQIDNIRQQIQALGNITINFGGGGNRGIGNTTAAMQNATRQVANLYKQIKNMELKVGKLGQSGFDGDNITEYNRQLNTLRNTYNQLLTSLSSQNVNLDGVFTQIDQARSSLAQLSSVVDNAQTRFASGIQLKIDNGSLQKQITSIQQRFNSLNVTNDGVADGIRELQRLLMSMDGSDNVEHVTANYRTFEQTLESVTNQVVELERVQQQSLDTQKLNRDRQALSSTMDVWLKNNSAAARQFGGQIDELKVRLRSCNSVELDGIKAEFQEVKRQAELAGKATLTFGDSLKQQMSKLGTYFSASMIITEGIQAVRKMYENVVEVDTAMTGLYRVTDLTATQYDMLYDDMVSSAKEYGSTLTDIINSTSDWVRLGFDANQANQLSEITAMYQHISDLDYDVAVENLVTAYKGFQDQLLNLYNGDEVAAISYVADIFNELGNNYAVSAEDVGAALTRSASALDLAGNTIQESAAMVTGIAEVTQDPEKAGSALKVLSLRLRGMKGELEELGEDVDENVESLSKMQTQVLNLSNGKVNIFNDDGSFKSTYEIMDAIADIYYDLSSTDQSDLLETIAGKNRANDVAALIANWGQVEAAMKSAMEAEGSATAENAKYMESIQGRLNELTASWQAFSNTFINSDFVKVLITGLTDVLNLLDAIVKTFGSFGTIGAGVAIFNIFKNKDMVSNVASFTKALFSASASFDEFDSAATAAGKSIKTFASSASGIATGIGLAVAAIGLAVNAYQNYRQELRETWQSELDSANASLENADAFEEAYIKISYFASKASLTAEEEKELAAAIGSANSALGDNAIAFDTATGSASDYLEKLKEVTQEELKQNKIDATKARQSAENLLKDEAWSDWSGDKIGVYLNNAYTEMSEEMAAARKIVDEMMSDYIDITTKSVGGGHAVRQYDLEPINWDENHEDMDAVVDYYYKLVALQDELAFKGLTTNSIYENTSSTINSLKDSVEAYVKAKYQEVKADYEFSSGIPTTLEGYQTMRDSILSSLDVSEEYKTAIGNMLDADYSQLFDLSKLEQAADKAAKVAEEQKQKIINSFGNTTGRALSQSAKDAYKEYKEEIDKLNQLGFDPSQTIFGNIDTNNRQVLEWTKENLDKYKTILESWHPDMSWDEITNDYFGKISTVLGTSGNYDGVEIAFTPMLQTENGAVILDNNTVDKYIYGIIDKAGEGWTSEDLFRLDAEGIEVDGQKIKGLIADIGDTAIQTQEAMHYVGKDGSIANSFKSLEDAAKQAGVSVDELLNSLSNNEEIQKWFDSLSPDEKNLLYTIDVEANDTTLWTLTHWKQELADLSATGQSSTESITEFYKVLNNTEDGNFSDSINGKIESITRLQEALVNIHELTDEDILDLAMDFPSLIGKTGDVQTLSQAISELIQQTQIGLDDEFATQLEALGGSSTTAGQALLALQSMVNSVTGVGWSFDIDKEIEKFNSLYDAMKESVSGTGLSTEGIKNVEQMFSGLEGYNPSVLFERTEHGIHLNTSALRALQSQYESMNKLDIQKRLQNLKQNYNDTKHELDNLTAGTDEYNKKAAELKDIENQIYDVQTLAAQYEGLTSAYNKWILAQSSGEEGDMYDNITSSLEDINQLYNDGLVGTNAFRTAVQMMTNEDLSTANIEKLMSVYQEGYPVMQRYFTDSQAGCIRFLEDVQSLNSEWAKMNEDGTWEINFGIGNDDEIAAAISQMTGLEMSTEQVQIILRKLSDYGFDINLDSAYTSVEELQSRIEETETKLKELGQEPIDIDVYCDVSELDTEIENAKAKIAEINSSNIDPEVKTAQLDDANAKLDALISRKIELSQPEFMSIDVSEVDSSIQGTLTLLQEYQTAVNNLDALELKGADASEIEAASAKVDELAGKIQELPDDIKATIGLEDDGSIETIKSQIENADTELTITADVSQATTSIEGIEGTDVEVTVTTSGNAAIDALKTAIDGIQDKTITISVSTTGLDAVNNLTNAVKLLTSKSVTATANAIGKANVDALKKAIDAVYSKTVNVKAKVSGKSDVDNLKKSIDKLSGKTVYANAIVSGTEAVKELKKAIDALKDKIVYVTTIQQTKAGASGTANANGTAHSNGTAYVNGTAYSKGDWGAKKSGVALGGELGQELVVRNGKWFTIGDKSAEFFRYKKGDIIFSAAQTEQIFRQGRITRGSSRGRALAEGTAFSGGTGGFWAGGKPVISSGGISGSDSNTAKDTSNNKTEDFKESFDWIEIAIDRIERAIQHLDTKASSVYKSWSNRNKSLTEEMDVIKDEIKLQEDAYSRYIEEADSIGLSSHMAELVRQGAIDINTVENEELAEKIKQYQEWYEKALDCRDAIDELEESLAECYKTAFDNVVAQYDGILSIIGHEKSMLDEYIAQSEAKGYVTSSKYYEALIRNEQDNIAELSNEKDALLAKLNEGLASGTIEKGSEAWYKMVNQIDEVTLAIEQGNTAILEYANSIRDIEWELFDMLQAQISQITNEADFLINLFSDDKLYDDRGQLTNEGMATMGLHGQNYNVYMAQADKYAQEILKIDKELANDPYNQDLLERRQELLELQQENILAAEDEKQAIVDMVREGIELELDALQELIDTYTDALDAQKDLYDYQKKIAQQTKKIADLEKQMSAYAGDTSEETKAKIQQIKVSLEEAKTNLEETEYERYISDQKKLLDDLYIEYETILNQRLDNIDALLEDMIEEINSNASMINTTLIEKADSVGYTLSESMSTIWDTSVTGINTVLTTYGQNIQNGIASAATTVNATLGAMNTNLQQMVAYLNTIANTKVTSASNSSASSSSSKSSSSSSSTTTKKSSSSSSSSSSNSSSKSTTTKSTSSTTSTASTSSSNTNVLTEKDYNGVALAIINGNHGWGTGSTRVQRLEEAGFDAGKVQSTVNQMMKEGSVHSGAWVGKYSGITNVKDYNYKNYAIGKRNFLKDEVAWTQDGGAEMIVRPSDGAILTPIARRDSVLSAVASGNIWEMANNPSEFIRDNLRLDGVDTPVGHGETTYTQNLEQVVFNLPNVKNYDELLKALKDDKNFERLIMAMTIDQMAGRTSLAKGKSIR